MARTGEYAVILGWFEQNPGEWITTPELAEAWAIDRVKARNAISIGLKHNLIVREAITKADGHRSSRFRLRNADEKREEFKVAERAVVARPQRTEPQSYPVLVECDPERATPILQEWLEGKAPKDRIQFLDANTAIIYNSPAQRENFRQMALSH